jgi:acetyl esterase/lipase
MTKHTLRYGAHADQEGDLYLASRAVAPVICLLHGGFWRMPYGRDQLNTIASDLQQRGYAVWNVGYRLIGSAAAGWPAPLDDVLSAVDFLTSLESGILDLDRIVLCGHSAGGQLALCAAAETNSATNGGVRVSGVVGQAAITDMIEAHALGLGNHAAAELLGGSPDTMPDRFAHASPRAHLPLHVPQLIIHGSADDVVPIALARDYVAAATNLGDDVAFLEIPREDHMAFLDPSSSAHAGLCDWLARVTG